MNLVLTARQPGKSRLFSSKYISSSCGRWVSTTTAFKFCTMLASATRRGFLRHWYAVEALPIIAIVGTVVSGASWALYRSSMGPTIQWTKANPMPFNTIKHNENTKILNHHPGLDSEWKRHQL